MPHFFIKADAVKNKNITISDTETFNHIAKSLRSKVGENLLLIDENKIQYETKISKISNKTILTEIIKSYPSNRFLDFELDLAQSPLRSDAQSIIIEKATELGVSKVIPIYTDNCVLKKDIIVKKIPKWQKIMFEASKQCERAVVPTCLELTTIGKILENNNYDKIIAYCERITDKTLKEFIKETPIKNRDKVLVIIGPEGGFSDKEFELFKNNDKIEMLTLGNLILKAETAVVVGLGNIIYEYENNIQNKI